MAWDFWAVPGARMYFGRMCWKQTLLGGLTGGCAPACRISAVSPMNPKHLLEAQGLLQTRALLGWSALSQDWWVPGLEQNRISASGLLLHTSVCPNHFGEPPWWFAGQEACLGEVLWCYWTWPCPDSTACASSLFPGIAARAPEQLLYVNSRIFWQFCTITSCLYRCSVKL